MEGLTGFVGVALRVGEDRKAVSVDSTLEGSPARK